MTGTSETSGPPTAVAQGARAAAGRLSGEFGPRLPVDVEAALHAPEAQGAPDQYFVDPISLGALLVSVAGLAWKIYQDIKAKSAKEPAHDVVERRVRVEIDAGTLTPEQRDRIIEVVVSETLSGSE
jgi:hypothetical protein